MKFLSTAFLLLCSLLSTAQTNPSGCIVYPYNAGVSYAGRVFTGYIGTSPNGPNSESPVIANDIRGKDMYNGGVNMSGANVPVNIACYRTPANTSNRECTIRFQTSNTTPPVYSYYGGVLAQNYYMCPIDDYIYILLLPISLCSICIIKKYYIA